MIALSSKGERTAALDVLSAATVRSLVRPEAAHFRESILKDITETFVVGAAGTLIPVVLGSVDLNRFDKVVSRIIKGIFFAERGKRLPPEYKVVNYSTAGLTKLPMAVGQQLKTPVEALMARDPKNIAGPEFIYWSDYSIADSDQSFWILVIHRVHCFIGWTVRTEETDMVLA